MRDQQTIATRQSRLDGCGPAMDDRCCPICGGGKRQRLFRQQFSAMSAGSLLRGYDVVVCDRCGFAFADGIPPQESFDRHYEAMSKYEHQDRDGLESEYDLKRFREVAQLVQQTEPTTEARVLDIGCATGGLLGVLKERGYKRLVGMDPSPVCVDAVRHLYGIEAVVGSMASLGDLDRAFDLVILSNVLEHIRELHWALSQVGKVLCPGGVAVIEVPDATRFSTFEDAPFQQFSTEHINFFSATSLANLMASAGYSPVLCQQNSYVDGLGFATGGPAVDAAFRMTGDAPRPLVRDVETEPALCEYVRQSLAVDDRIRHTIDTLLAADRPIIVWGAGTHTLRLLATSSLSQATIAAFVDSNPRYQGKQLNGIPIIAPAEVDGRNEPILISSRVFQRDIERQIRHSLGLNNELYLLYDL